MYDEQARAVGDKLLRDLRCVICVDQSPHDLLEAEVFETAWNDQDTFGHEKVESTSQVPEDGLAFAETPAKGIDEPETFS